MNKNELVASVADASGLSKVDKKHAEYIEHENCKLIKYQSSSHLIAQQLRESEELKSIIEVSLGI